MARRRRRTDHDALFKQLLTTFFQDFEREAQIKKLSITKLKELLVALLNFSQVSELKT